MPRRVYLLGVGVGLVSLAFVVTDRLLAPPLRVTEANANRVVGMTLAEAKAVLGENAIGIPDWGGKTTWVWVSRRGCVAAGLTAGRVAGTQFYPPDSRSAVLLTGVYGRPPEPGAFARLRDWLGW